MTHLWKNSSRKGITYEFELAGEKSYIVIRETKDGRLMFYSVVDKIKGR
mgnify:CR=1 FL=1